jgi:hypothetical protein
MESEDKVIKKKMISDLMKEENLKKLYKYLYFNDFCNCNVKGNNIGGYNGGIPDELVKKLLSEVNNTYVGNPKIKRKKLFDLVTTRRCLMVYDGTSVQIPKFNYRRYPDSSTIFITSFIPSEFRSDSKGVVTLSIDVVPRFDINMLNVTLKQSIMSGLIDSFNYVIYSPDKRFSNELSQRGITLVTPKDIGLEVKFSDYSDMRHFARRD